MRSRFVFKADETAYEKDDNDIKDEIFHTVTKPPSNPTSDEEANNAKKSAAAQHVTSITKNNDRYSVGDGNENNKETAESVSVISNDEYEDGVFVEGDTLLLTTGEVAKRLGISRDMTRQHIKDFSEFLHVSYMGASEGKYRHMRIPSTDVELLDWIVRLRKNRHSVDQVKDLLRDPVIADSLNFKGPDYNELFDEILKRNNKFLLGTIQNMLEGSTQENQKLLEQRREKDLLIDEMAKKIDALEQTIDQQNQLMTSMKDLLEEQVQAAQSSKKKGFFGFFK